MSCRSSSGIRLKSSRRRWTRSRRCATRSPARVARCGCVPSCAASGATPSRRGARSSTDCSRRARSVRSMSSARSTPKRCRSISWRRALDSSAAHRVRHGRDLPRDLRLPGRDGGRRTTAPLRLRRRRCDDAARTPGDRRARARARRTAEGRARERLVGTPPGQGRVSAGASLARPRLSSHQCAAIADDGESAGLRAARRTRRCDAQDRRMADQRERAHVRRLARAAARPPCASDRHRTDPPADRHLVERVSAGSRRMARLARLAQLARGGGTAVCARAARDAASRRRRTGSVASVASRLRSDRRPCGAERNAPRAVRTRAAAAAAAPGDRAVFRSVEGVVFWWRLAVRSDVGARPVRAVAAYREADRAMTPGVEFAQPWALLLLPLAVLPLLRRRRDSLAFSHLAWLPRDRLGQLAEFLWRALAVVAIASMAIALAGPERPETQVTRTGYGAEIVVLMDRSRSMDQRMLPSDWRAIDALT